MNHKSIQSALSSSISSKCIWILNEGSQGHLVQSRGLIRELAKTISIDVYEIHIQCVFSSKIVRSIVKRLLRFHPKIWLFRRLHSWIKLPEANPDLIISSGPHSLAALELLAKHYRCPSVLIQGTIHVPEGAVTAIMRPFEGEQREDYIFIPLLFTEITPPIVEEAKESFISVNPIKLRTPIYSLFLGNSSAKIRFSKEDWNGIIHFVNELWKREGIQWLITTSYRTGRELEALFKRGIDPDAIFEAVWYSEAPRKVTREYLGMASRVFVTLDSLTMLTEAVASGRPTTAMCPAHLPERESNTHLTYVRDLAKNGFISWICTGGTAPAVPAALPLQVIDYSDAIHELIIRLRWNV